MSETPSAPPSLVHALRQLRDVLVRHPIAVQAAFAALAAEGRRFAETPEGSVWRERLRDSELLDRVEVLWRSLGMNAFVERQTEILPSFFLESAMRAAARLGLEPLLSTVFDETD
jgi:hypothetical protein